MSVRSQRLAAGVQGAGAASTPYTVPAGYRTIIKGIFVRNTNAAAQRVVISIYSGATDIVDTSIWMGANGGATEQVWMDTFQVMYAGESIKVAVGLASCIYLISGAELLL